MKLVSLGHIVRVQQPAGSGGVFNNGQDFQLVPLPLALPAGKGNQEKTPRREREPRKNDSTPPT